jgi:O-antigen/teichoic acid export membrane protein
MKSFSPKQKILVNAISSSVQVVIVGVVYFFLYKFLLNKLGSVQLGIWSLVLATSSIASLANLGITSGMVKFIADYEVKKEFHLIGVTIYTAFFSLIFFISIIAIVIFFFGEVILQQIITGNNLELALKILPISVACLCINTLSGIFTSVLEGLQKNYIKNIIYSISSLVLLLLAYVLTPKWGLVGVAYAQLLQSVFIIVLAFIFSLKYYSIKVFFKNSWSNQVFKKLFNYGAKFQLISLAQMLYEPTTKMLLGKFGGLEFLGFYEMANRLVSQVRSVIVSANQVMIPVIAQANITNKQNVVSIYNKSMSLLLFVSLFFVLILSIATPSISLLWIGHIEKQFIFSSYILIFSTLINIMCGPAYFSFLAEGYLKILLITHLAMAVMNVLFGYIFGYTIGGFGVVIAWAAALSVGSFWCIYMYQTRQKIINASIFNKSDYILIIFCFVIASIYSYFFWNESSKGLLILYAIISLVVATPFFILNTNLKKIWYKFKSQTI